MNKKNYTQNSSERRSPNKNKKRSMKKGKPQKGRFKQKAIKVASIGGLAFLLLKGVLKEDTIVFPKDYEHEVPVIEYIEDNRTQFEQEYQKLLKEQIVKTPVNQELFSFISSKNIHIGDAFTKQTITANNRAMKIAMDNIGTPEFDKWMEVSLAVGVLDNKEAYKDNPDVIEKAKTILADNSRLIVDYADKTVTDKLYRVLDDKLDNDAVLKCESIYTKSDSPTHRVLNTNADIGDKSVILSTDCFSSSKYKADGYVMNIVESRGELLASSQSIDSSAPNYEKQKEKLGSKVYDTYRNIAAFDVYGRLEQNNKGKIITHEMDENERQIYEESIQEKKLYTDLTSLDKEIYLIQMKGTEKDFEKEQDEIEIDEHSFYTQDEKDIDDENEIKDHEHEIDF